jgi:hypothetical protein
LGDGDSHLLVQESGYYLTVSQLKTTLSITENLTGVFRKSGRLVLLHALKCHPSQHVN